MKTMQRIIALSALTVASGFGAALVASPAMACGGGACGGYAPYDTVVSPYVDTVVSPYRGGYGGGSGANYGRSGNYLYGNDYYSGDRHYGSYNQQGYNNCYYYGTC